MRAVPPVPEQRSADALAAYTGEFETIAVELTVVAVDGQLDATITYRPETLAQLREAGEDAPEESPTYRLGLLPGGDRYVVVGGAADGMRGYFSRDAQGRVDGLHLGGRLAGRVGVRT